ncbi:MAG: iron-containing alcohol dehydrogenase, partial [Oscillospiraceae bacterium]|nr:iron-containing alcohol dehydrogenase [Oscillospiraceae bacterium]
MPDAVGELGLPRQFAVIYDENTRDALGDRVRGAHREIVLDPAGLHADERGVAAAEEKLGDEPLLAAAGAGTVHDITRYIAAKRGVPFISVPTAASVDAYASGMACITFGGFKNTIPAVAPSLVFADTQVAAAAPSRLTASGFGDALGKFVSLADWDVAHILTGEYICTGVASLEEKAVEEAAAAAEGAASGGEEAAGKLMKALLLSGVAMQLAGSSRPASGAEHHVSHLTELGVPWLPQVDALHGEKVGVGTLLSLRAYSRWRVQVADALVRAMQAWRAPTEDMLRSEFGPAADAVIAENAEDCLKAVTPAAIKERWISVKARVGRLPGAGEIERLLKAVGAPTTLDELGIDPDLEGRILRWSPYVRNRLTFMRLMGASSAVSDIHCCIGHIE